jgi:hypothetical protein
MAGAAKGHQIIIIMRTAIGNGDNMMDFINGNISSGLEAMFTYRVLGHIKLTEFAPMRTVVFAVVAAMNFIIFPAGNGLVCRTITAFADGSRTAGISTGLLG